PFEAGRTWGQRVFFNKNGERCALTAERLSDFRAREEKASGSARPTADKALDLVLLVQVPLVHKEPERAAFGFGGMAEGVQYCLSMAAPGSALGSSDVEEAVLGHGKVEFGDAWRKL